MPQEWRRDSPAGQRSVPEPHPRGPGSPNRLARLARKSREAPIAEAVDAIQSARSGVSGKGRTSAIDPVNPGRKQGEPDRDFRALFDGAHDAILIFDPMTEIVLQANRKACEMYGFTEREFIGMSLKTISEDVGRGEKMIVETLRRPAHHRFETLQRRKDGSRMWLEVSTCPIEHDDRRAILTINRDITDRRMAEESARQAAAVSDALIRTAGVLNSQLDLPSVLAATCRESAHMLCASAAIVMTHDMPADRLRVSADFGLSESGLEPVSELPADFCLRCLRRGGAVVHRRSVDMSPLFLETGGALPTTYVGANLVGRRQHVGSLWLLFRDESRRLGAHESTLLAGLAHQAGLAIASFVGQPPSEEVITRAGIAVRPPAPDLSGILTTRERAVLAGVGRGLSAKQVAARLGISPRTAEFHKGNVMRKLGLKSHGEVVRYAVLRGLAPPE